MDIKKHIINQITHGNIQEVINIITINGLESGCALAVFVSCCTLCSKHLESPEKLSQNGILELLLGALPYMNNILDEESSLKYLQSVHHILRFYIKKESYESISKMEDIFMPKFLPPIMPDTHRKVFHGSAILIYNAIITLGNKNKSLYNPYLREICKIATLIMKKVFEPINVLTMSYGCALSMSALKVDLQEQIEYYFYVIETLKDKEVSIDFIIKPLMDYASFILDECKADFHKIQEILEHSQTKICKEEIAYFYEMFKICLVLNYADYNFYKEARLSQWTQCYNTIETSYPELFCHILCKVKRLFFNLLIWYEKRDIKIFANLSSHMISALLECIKRICSHLTPKICKCCNDCTVSTNQYESLTLVVLILSQIKWYIKEVKTVSTAIYKDILNWTLPYLVFIEFLKEKSCKKWKDAWKILSSKLWELGILLYNHQNEAYIEYMLALLESTIRLEGFSPKIVKPETVDFALNALCKLSFQKKEYRKCMALTAFHMLLCPMEGNIAFEKWWPKSKHSLKNTESGNKEDDIQKVTVVSALQKYNDCLSGIIGSYGYPKLTNKEKARLLASELKLYKKVWKSKDPILSAFKELCEVADIEDVIKTIIDVFGDCNLRLSQPALKLFKEISCKCEEYSKEKNCFEANLSLAIAYFHVYKYETEDIALKNAAEMERTMVSMDRKTTISSEIKDVNEDCDIVSSYENLKLYKYINSTDNLKKVLELIKLDKTGNICPYLWSVAYTVLFKVAIECSLQCFDSHSLEAFYLALEYARLLKSPEKILHIISFILETSNLQNSAVQNLMTEADQIVNSFGTQTTTERHNVLLTYYLIKAKVLYEYDIQQSYKFYMMVDQLFHEQTEKSGSDCIEIQLHMLSFKFDKLCLYHSGRYTMNTLTFAIHAAFEIVLGKLKTVKGDAYELCVCLNTIQELARIYNSLRLPRDVISYTKNVIMLAQQLTLPLRCVYFLLYLAHADLQRSQFDHFKVKLNGLEDILYFPQDNFVNEEMKKNQINEDIDNTAEAMELHLNLNDYSRQPRLSSPILHVERFKLPAFVSHEETCKCFCCNCFEYHKLLIENARLNALYNNSQQNMKLANTFFRGAIRLYHILRKTYYKRLGSNNVVYAFFDFDYKFTETYASLLLDYGAFLMQNKYENEALKFIDNLLDVLKGKKEQFTCLYSCALMQKLGYLTAVQVDSTNQTIISSSTESECSDYVLSTTPDSKQTAIIIKVQDEPSKTIQETDPSSNNVLVTPEIETHNSRRRLRSSKIQGTATICPEPRKSKALSKGSIDNPIVQINADNAISTEDDGIGSQRQNLKKCKLFEILSHSDENYTENNKRLVTNRTCSLNKGKMKHVGHGNKILSDLNGASTKKGGGAPDDDGHVSNVLQSKTKLLTQKLKSSSSKRQVAVDPEQTESKKLSLRYPRRNLFSIENNKCEKH